MEDGDIVALYWARSESAIFETAAKYGGYCRAIAYNILFNAEDAEESVNDAYMAAWNSMPPHRPSILSAFLGKLTRRIAIDRWRRRGAEKRGGGEMAFALDELAECIPSGHDVEREILSAELEEAVRAFVKTLPGTERWVFIGRYWFLKPISELGGKFGFCESKVKSMLYRTRKKLMLYLRKEGVL
ncbi:MAG: RNA polymerase sigma factor [Clostridiaceae bacterium]|nr:RNA polymerase sigma factor [Eubacteriales bacterium]